jgi:hypothetical protein
MESDDNSRLSFEDNFSMRTQTLVRVASEKQICSLSCTTSRSNGNASIRMRKEIRKMTQTRQRRHMITRCNDRVVFGLFIIQLFESFLKIVPKMNYHQELILYTKNCSMQNDRPYVVFKF